ncbi:MAG: Lrp/AsnC family transcriptional regulator [Hyphomicrobiaceae bacterium]|nr:Lrp/AsnC family transcriptional regulator [Hyphomicrobiaceae bacterium]
MLDPVDRRIINALQGGFPVAERPYLDAAAALQLSEGELIDRLSRLLDMGALSRFGPMFNADRLGGGYCLCAMAVPPAELEAAAAIVNGFVEVAHNYERQHALNMWFVVASDDPARLDAVIAEIEAMTGREVLSLPKLEEFYVGLRVEA